MKTRNLGRHGLQVSAIRFGAMVLTGCYGAVGEARALEAVQHALSLGIDFFATSGACGGGQIEELLGRALAGRRGEAVIATKFGIVLDDETPGTPIAARGNIRLRINGTPKHASQAIDRSLTHLGTEVIDLWCAHNADPPTPIRGTVGAMAENVKSGKARYPGLSNVTADELRRAHQVHPIAAVQAEYSLFNREAEAELLPATHDLGVGFVPWAPLGRGFLSGTVTEVAPDNFRRRLARFAPKDLQESRARCAPVWQLAAELGVGPAQMALAWLPHQYEGMVPIPGSSRQEHIDANATAADMRLSARQLATLYRARVN